MRPRPARCRWASPDPDLAALWEECSRRGREAAGRGRVPIPQEIPDHFMILVTCRDEPHQRKLLARFHADGLECKCLMS